MELDLLSKLWGDKPSPGKYQYPLKAGKTYDDKEPWIISTFVGKSVNISPRHPHGHEALDIGGPKGAPVYPIGPGIVIEQGAYPKGGIYCKIQHFPDKKLVSYYAHLDKCLVSVNDKVNFNTIIGLNGNTGSAKGTAPHVHLECKLNGAKVDPKTIIGKNIGSFTSQADKVLKMASIFELLVK
jgi:murein DD-endopeptidase MepM/ murein hydrolase activator NlpD